MKEVKNSHRWILDYDESRRPSLTTLQNTEISRMYSTSVDRLLHDKKHSINIVFMCRRGVSQDLTGATIGANTP